MRSSKWVVAPAIVLLTAMLAGTLLASRSARSAERPLAAEAARPQSPAAAPTASLEMPPTLGPGARLVFMGDSVGGNVARALVPEAARRGAVVTPHTVPGCSNIAGLPVTADDQIIPWGPNCLRHLEQSWRAMVAATPADAVLWLSSFDASRRLIEGVIADPATPEGRVRIAGLILNTANIVAPVGSARRIVFLLPAPQSPSYFKGDADPGSVASVESYRAILHLVVGSDPTRFSMLSLDAFLCPAGPPCPVEVAPGVAPRAVDGRHFVPAGAAWLAPQILDSLGVD
ncbi:MAG: SGNH hydrolase domain-containing protein [Acidimicrobiia bacterium]